MVLLAAQIHPGASVPSVLSDREAPPTCPEGPQAPLELRAAQARGTCPPDLGRQTIGSRPLVILYLPEKPTAQGRDAPRRRVRSLACCPE